MYPPGIHLDGSKWIRGDIFRGGIHLVVTGPLKINTQLFGQTPNYGGKSPPESNHHLPGQMRFAYENHSFLICIFTGNALLKLNLHLLGQTFIYAGKAILINYALTGQTFHRSKFQLSRRKLNLSVQISHFSLHFAWTNPHSSETLI